MSIMKKRRIFFHALMLVFLSHTGMGMAQTNPKAGSAVAWRPSDVYPDRIIIKFKDLAVPNRVFSTTGNAQTDALLSTAGVQSVERVLKFAPITPPDKPNRHLENICYANLGTRISVAAVIEIISKSPDIEYVEPVYKQRLFLTPNDPLLDQQTYFSNIEMLSAWDVVRGSSGDVIVAIIDGGTDVDHPDLAANVWINQDEIPNNGLDDDGNGFVDDRNGWNFANNTPDPTGLSQTPSSADHGTITAGLACAVTDNSTGIAGTSWNSRLMPLNAVDPTQDGVIKFGYEAIVYAVENGADVLNLSWGRTGPPSQFELNIINFAHEQGVAIVASAGNDNAAIANFPAAYPNVTAVASTNASDSKSFFSTFGNSVDISAPGEGMFSTLNNGEFGELFGGSRGTSFSAPLVAGVVALVRTHHPDWLGIQAAEQVRTTARNIDASLGAFAGLMGKGLLNANRAVTLALPSLRITGMEIFDESRDGIIQAGENIEVILTIINYLEPAAGINFDLTVNDPFITLSEGFASLSSLNTLEEKEISFIFDVDPAAPSGDGIGFQVAISSPGYSDRDRFSLTIDPPFRDLGVNNIAASVTNLGRIGFADANMQTGGNGLSFKGSPNLLYEGALIVGTGPTMLSNAARSTISGGAFNHDNDFAPVEATDFKKIAPGAITDEESVATYADSRSNTPLGLEIKQETFAQSTAPNDDFILFRFTVQNLNAVDLENFHFGMFFDWDIAVQPGDEANNAADFSPDQKLGFAHAGNTFIGSALMTDDSLSYRSINAGGADFNLFDGFSDTEKWQAISGGIQTTHVDSADVAMVIATGPVTVPANESIEIGFALVAGESRSEIETNAASAQQLWNGMIATSVETVLPTLPRAFSLAQNFPNPFNPTTVISYELAEPSDVELTIFNMLGQKVRTLVNEKQITGAYSSRWDGLTDSGQQVASGIFLYTLRAGKFRQTRKLVLMK